ncbi:MAG TPA: serine/threonine-protein kinase, partial [Pilimelia sp.]|nr:serine/threonine-protein kinase [Pilimelia sp.]
MSVVWRGYDEVLGRQVAVKVLAPELAADDAFRHRIRVEAQAAARLCHPHITNVYDYGEAACPDGTTAPYVVMELLDGEPMSARLRAGAALPWRTAVAACAQVASALAVAHARGVVHRDVTANNVMLTAAGAKVVDFGISALVGEKDSGPDGTLLGTPAYLAPERLDPAGAVSPATDVYAAGVLLYRAVTGRLPWHAATTTQMLKAHRYVEPEPLPAVDGLPAEVADLCARCLAKDPADRPTSTELARTLAAAAGVVVFLPAPVPAASAAESAAPAAAAASPGVGVAGAGPPWDIASMNTTILPWLPPGSGGSSDSAPSTGHAAGLPGRLRGIAVAVRTGAREAPAR